MNKELCTENELETENKTAGRWTTEEHCLFLDGLRLHQKQWKSIADLVKTRTVVQIRTHAQKYFQKLEKSSSAHNFHSSEESASSTELNPSEVDDFRRTGYRTNSISSTDSLDSMQNHGKFGRSVSISSDGGCTDNDIGHYNSCRSGSVTSVSSSFANASFQSDLLMMNLGAKDGKQNLRPRAVSMNDYSSKAVIVKAGSIPKKRSREKTLSAAAGKVSVQQSFVSTEPMRAPKSPKRSYNKQLNNSTVKIESASVSREIPIDVAPSLRGDYFNFPPQSQPLMYSQAQSFPSQSYFDSLKVNGICNHITGESEDDLDMIDLLDRIDWTASPTPSPALVASSPFTDSTVSLSSSCDAMPRFYSPYGCAPQCVSFSPSFSLHSRSLDGSSSAFSQPPMTAEQEDEFDVFDEFYKDMDLIDADQCGQLSQLPISIVKSEVYNRTLLHQNTIKNTNIGCNITPFTATNTDLYQCQEPTHHRVSFASVIDEFKAKAREAQSGGESVGNSGGSSSCTEPYFPMSQSFLRPARLRPESTKLPSLSTLTSGASTVVISPSSLTLMDPTFSSNYPLVCGDSPLGDDQQQQRRSFGFGQYLSEGGGMSAVSLDSAHDDAHLHYSYGHNYHATPPNMSPAAKKRGRPRKVPLVSLKGSDAATVTPTIVVSKSLNNLSTSSGCGSTNMAMLKITSQPNFPGSLPISQYQQGKHSFDDFLLEGSSAGSDNARSESLFAIESSSGTLFPADVCCYSPKPSASAFQHDQQTDDAVTLYSDPFQYDGGDCNDLMMDAEVSFGFALESQHQLEAPYGDLSEEMMYFDMLGAAFE